MGIDQRLCRCRLADRCFATVPVSPLCSKNVPPEHFLTSKTRLSAQTALNDAHRASAPPWGSIPIWFYRKLERVMGIDQRRRRCWRADRCWATVPASPLCSKNVPPGHFLHEQTPLGFDSTIVDGKSGAGDGNRTHTTSLEGWGSTIELHPHHNRRQSNSLPHS